MAIKGVRLVVTSALLLGAVAAHAGISSADLCKDKKVKASGRYATGVLKAFGKNERTTNTATFAEDVTKAESRLAKRFSAAELTATGIPRECQTTGDAGAIRAKADAFVDDVLTELRPTTTSAPTSSTSTTTTSTTTTTAPQIACAATTYPTCGGSCPPLTQCQATIAIENYGPACECVSTFGDACGGPACGPPGRCPSGQVCMWAGDTSPLKCGCASPPICWEGAFPQCGGNCPPGLQCIGFNNVCLCG
jgi:hypothetical protein